MRIFSKVMPAKRWMLTISCIGVLGLVAFSGILLFEATKAQVDITENGEKETIQTHADTVHELLDEVGITVGEHDELSPGMDTTIKDGMAINHQTAKQVIVTMDKDNDTYYTTVDTVGAFLDAEGIETKKHDDISTHRSDKITDGMQITIDQAFQVTIKDDGDENKVWTTDVTVEDLLQENDISLNDLDKVKPSPGKTVQKNKTINITRVATETDKVEEALAFETVTKEDDSLLEGKEKVVSEGQEGTIVKEFEITKENGKKVDKELVNEEVTKEKKDRVVAIGTKKPKPKSKPKPNEEKDIVTLAESSNEKSNESNEPTESGGKVMYMTATGYTAQCNGCSGITYTGIDLNNNPNAKVVAVDPNVIPLGTKVWVEGYGEAIAGDIGGAIKGNRIDIHVPTKAETHQYNWKKVKVKILD